MQPENKLQWLPVGPESEEEQDTDGELGGTSYYV